MLETGAAAPGFEVPGSDGERIARYRLSDFTDSGAVVLLFYPFDFSPICTEELCNFRDSEWLTFTPNLDVFGISTDSAYAHQKNIRENDLPFPLLSDHDGRVSESYGVLAEELEDHPNVSKRAVFVIDQTDTVRYAWEGADILHDPDIEAVHDAVQSLEVTQSGGH